MALAMNPEEMRVFLIKMFFHGEMPDQAAAIAAAALYGIVAVSVAAATIKTRAWFMMTVAITGLLEMIGFAFRAAFLVAPNLGKFVAMQFLLIVSPVLLDIVEYCCVGRLLAMSPAGRTSRLARWSARLFTASDIVCLLIQASAGGLLGSGNTEMLEMGANLMLAGLALQLGFFTAFTMLTVYVHAAPKFGFRGSKAAMPLFAALYCTIALMFVRNIFRVVEFSQGWDGYLATHEAYFYGLDLAPIWTCFLLFTFLHYGFFLGPAAEAAAAATAAADSAASGASGKPRGQQGGRLEVVVTPIGGQ